MAIPFCRVCFDPRLHDLEEVLKRGVPFVSLLGLLPYRRPACTVTGATAESMPRK
jgi:hypothetical protein